MRSLKKCLKLLSGRHKLCMAERPVLFNHFTLSIEWLLEKFLFVIYDSLFSIPTSSQKPHQRYQQLNLRSLSFVARFIKFLHTSALICLSRYVIFSCVCRDSFWLRVGGIYRQMIQSELLRCEGPVHDRWYRPNCCQLKIKLWEPSTRRYDSMWFHIVHSWNSTSLTAESWPSRPYNASIYKVGGQCGT